MVAPRPVTVSSVSDEPDEVTAACTKAVVASCVVFVPLVAVGPVGVPVSAGLASLAKSAESES